MNWMEEFIRQCLAEVPRGRYRRRVEKELRDHMQVMSQTFPAEEVLRVMGDPEQLRKEYYAAWKHSPGGRGNLITSGCVMIWALMFVTAGLLECLNQWFYLIGTPMASVLLYLIPFSLGAAFLRTCFWKERCRAWWVTLGLLVEWAWVNASYVGVYALMMTAEPWAYADWNLPWLTGYLLASLAGCLILGWLFGQKTEKRHEME